MMPVCRTTLTRAFDFEGSKPVRRRRNMAGLLGGAIDRREVIPMDARSFHTPLSHLDATAVIDALSQPLLILDADCCVAYANRASLRLLAAPLSALQGRPLHHLFVDGPDLTSRLRGLFADVVDATRSLRTTVTELARPGRPLRLSALAVEDEMSGGHLVVELARQRQRKTPTRRLAPLTLVGARRDQRECA